MAAAQRHDGDGDRDGGLLECGRGGRHRRPIADPDDGAGPQRVAQDLRREPADHPARQILGPGDRRREMDGIEPERSPESLGGGALDGRPIVDPDLDDALGPRSLEQARDLRPRDAELLGDRVLRLAQLVVQAARPDELLEVAHVRPPGRPVHVCTIQMCSHAGGIIARARGGVNPIARCKVTASLTLSRRRDVSVTSEGGPC